MNDNRDAVILRWGLAVIEEANSQPNDVAQQIIDTKIVAAITSTVTFFVGRWWGRYKAGRQWQKQEFLNRIIVSLNIFADGYLKIRTVLERSR